MFLIVFEVIFALIVLWFIVSQIIIPLTTGTKMFPAFRGGKKAVIKDMILDEKEEIEIDELRHSLDELRQKEKEKEDGKV